MDTRNRFMLFKRESCGTCSSYDILCQEFIVTPVY